MSSFCERSFDKSPLRFHVDESNFCKDSWPVMQFNFLGTYSFVITTFLGSKVYSCLVIPRWQEHISYGLTGHIALKMKVSIKDFFSNCDQICSLLRIWSHFLKKSLMENFIFCAVTLRLRTSTYRQHTNKRQHTV